MSAPEPGLPGLFKLARALRDTDAPEAARDVLRGLVATAPRHVEGAILLADLHERLGAPDTAIATLRRLAGQFADADDRPPYLDLRIARLAEQIGDTAVAVLHFAAHLRATPGDADIADRLLRLRLQEAAPVARRRVAATHRREVRDTPRTAALVAILVGLDEAPTAAARALVEMADIVAEDAALALLAIDALLDAREREAAAALLAAARDRHPDDLRLDERAVRLLAAGDASSEEVRAAALALAGRAEAGTRLRVRLATLLLGRGDDPGALGVAEQALAEVPTSVDAAEVAIRAALRLERDAHAEALLAATLAAIEPDDHPGRARLLLASGRAGEAVRLLEPEPDRAPALLADALVAEGEYARAEALLAPIVAGPAATPRLRRLAARLSAAIAIAPDPDARFPEALFEAVFARPGNRAAPASDTIVLMSSTLAVAGAERQAALSAAAAARARAARPGARTVLFTRSLDPARGHDALLPLVQDPALAIEDLSRLSPGAALRALAAAGEDPAVLRIIAAFPDPLMGDIALLYARFRALRPRLVHLWQDGLISVGGVAAVLAGVPRIVAAIRNVLPEPGDRRRSWRFFRPMYRALAARDDVRFVANSAAGARDYAAMMGLAPDAIAVIHNGIDVPAIRERRGDPAAIRAALGIPADARIVGGAFRLAPAKRPQLWIAAAAEVARVRPDVHFLLVGDGTLRAPMEALAVELGLAGRIHFAGQRRPIEPWLAVLDLFVLASSVEGLPNVLIEAQALGVPAITTPAGGAPEAIADGSTGLVVTDATPAGLAAAITALLDDAPRRGAMAAAAPGFIHDRFGLDRMIAATLALYDEP